MLKSTNVILLLILAALIAQIIASGEVKKEIELSNRVVHGELVVFRRMIDLHLEYMAEDLKNTPAEYIIHPTEGYGRARRK